MHYVYTGFFYALLRMEINEHEKTFDPNNIRDFVDGYLLEIQKRKDDPSFCSKYR